jgi:hypothetical protein
MWRIVLINPGLGLDAAGDIPRFAVSGALCGRAGKQTNREMVAAELSFTIVDERNRPTFVRSLTVGHRAPVRVENAVMP